MRPNATLLSLLLSPLLLAAPARAAELPAAPPAPGAPGVAARLPAQAPPEAAARAVEATDSGALPTASVPAPRLVRSAGAQARQPEPEAVAEDEASDSPVIAAEVHEESAELEDLRKAEEASRVQDAPTADGRAGASADGLGLESPIRDRVEGAVKRQATTPAGEGGGHIALLPEIDHDLAQLQAEYDIPVEVNPAVVAYIRFFQSPVARAHFVKWLGRSHRYLDRYREILRAEGIPEDTVYLAMIESGFGNFAYSRAKASGPWQFIASTGKLMGLHQDFWVDERRDPERSAHAAAHYLKRLYQQTGDWRLAWAGYNAGVGRVFSAVKKGYSDFWSMAAAPGKRVLRPETKGYVPKLMAAAIISKHTEAFGFKAEEIEKQAWTDYQEVEVPNATLLSVLARAAGVEERAIVDLNPELRRACTPPHPYQLKIPAQTADTFAENWPAMQDKARMTFVAHVIRRGDSLARVAALYGVPVQGIREMNDIPAGKRLKVGTELVIPRPSSGGLLAARLPPEPEQRAAPPTPRVRPTRTVAASMHPVASARAGRTTLRVRSGDTLWSISQKYGVDVDELCRWNGIRNPRRHRLLAGSRLVVYAERG